MALVVSCGGCNARYQVNEQLAGTLVDCPKCKTRMLVPRKGAAPGAGTAKIAAEPVARPAAAAPSKQASKAPTTPSKPTRSAPTEADDEIVVRFRDEEDEMPARRETNSTAGTPEADEDEFDLVPDVTPPRRSSGGSIAGQSRGGQTRAGQSTAGQSKLGQTRAGQSQAGQSKAGRSRAGGSRVGAELEPASPDLNELLDIKEPEVAVEQESDFHFAIPQLPPLLTQVLLPWVLTIGGLGWAGYVCAEHVLNLPGRPIGFSMLGAGFLLYAALLVPLTLRSIHSAAISGKLRLPNVVWFQTFSLLALPTAGLIVGYDAGGTGAMLTLGLLGLVGMGVLMVFMYHATVMQALLTAMYGAFAYVASAALCVGILVGAGLILGRSGLVVPWQTVPAEVAAAPVNPPAPVVSVPTPVPVVVPVAVAPKPVAAPVAATVAAPVAVAPSGPLWRMPVEPVGAGLAWPAVENQFRESIEVITPVTTAHAVGGGPFVAFLQPHTTAIYDVRTGKRSGFIKTAFEANNLVISADGTMLAGVEPADTTGMFAGADDAARGIEIWSTADGQMAGHVPNTQQAAIPTALAFAGGRLIAMGMTNGVSGLEAWDPATGLIAHQWSTPPVSRASMAVSNSGKFVAVAAGAVVRILDVVSGEVAGELTAPIALSPLKGMAFSQDGKTLAAVVPGNVNLPGSGSGMAMALPATLLEWDISGGGQLTRAVPIDLASAAPPFDPAAANAAGGNATALAPTDVPYLQWTPGGQMVRIGDGLFEVTSGKSIYSLPPETSGNLSGRLISVADKRATYEFLPTGVGSHLVLKTFDLPSATIDPAVAFAAASVLKPMGNGTSGANASAVGSTGVGVATLVTPSPAGPSSGTAFSALLVAPPTLSAGNASPQATAQLAAEGTWDVQLKSIRRPDPLQIQNELSAQYAAIQQIQSNLDSATARADKASTPQESAVLILQNQLRAAKANALKLEKDSAAAAMTRTALAVLEDGPNAQTPVEVTTDSAATAALVDFMHVGDRVRITGTGQVNAGTLVVKLATAAPLPAK